MPLELNSEADLPEQWQSLEQWLQSPNFHDFIRNEFPDDAAEWLDPVTRRRFLQLMGASIALAGAAGCNPSLKPASARQAVPYVEQPAEILPGVPLYFATAMPLAGGVATGLLVKQVEGRPLKIEGNPHHPGSLGGTDLYAQASILGMYDPDRSKVVTEAGAAISYEQLQSKLRSALESQVPKRGAGLRILTGATTSPTLIHQIQTILERLPEAKWLQWEAISRANLHAATLAAFGKIVEPVYQFDQADVVLSLGSDFLAATGPGGVRYARDFTVRRKVRLSEKAREHHDGVALDEMNRLYVVESMVSCTGAVADHRLPLKPSEIEAFARALANALKIPGIAPGSPLPELAQQWLAPLAEDLRAHSGKVLVIAGEHLPPAVQQIAFVINQNLGAVGKTIRYIEPLTVQGGDSPQALKTLYDEIQAKAIDILLCLEVNPVYDAPQELNFAQALEKVPTRVHLGLYVDETAIHCNWHVNATHYLETWGDCRAYDGTVAIQQPLIAPLTGGHSSLELISYVAKSVEELVGTIPGAKPVFSGDPLEVLRGYWRSQFHSHGGSGDFDLWWQQVVRAGVIPGTQRATLSELPAASTTGLDQASVLAKPSLELQFLPDPTLFDGRFANNGWLQELPKPITKLTWDNAAIISPATAEKYGITNSFPLTGGEHGRTKADMVQLTVGDRSLNVAAFILPGHADDSITLYLGHGRTRAGQTGTDTGFYGYKLRTLSDFWQARDVEIKKLNETYSLACTQGQYAMESRRPARSATIAQFKKDREFAQIPPASAGEYKEIRQLTPGTIEDFDRLGLEHPSAHDHGLMSNDHHHHGDHHSTEAQKDDHQEHGHGPHDSRLIPLSLYPKYPQQVNGQQAVVSYRRWGMAIDLGACTACSACVVACQAENNIPVVGKTEVTRGRAMHWIRIDRYFSIPGTETMSDELGARDIVAAKRQAAAKQSARIKTNVQPVMCAHCEKAPCEVVCPVAATVHSADGLNDMIYNRCVGTRYCSNNCPYKVRRFNFLQYADYTTESLKLLNNPEVSVRQRGVMEKCTYCVQRIRNAEIEAEREWQTRPKDPRTGRPIIKDGEVITACQAACPTGAIMFGDINDDTSAVLRWKAEPHNYGLLAELNTMPRTSYLAAIRNPNPKLDAFAS